MTARIYVNKRKEITIICPACGRIKTQLLAPPVITGKPIKIKCGCGCIFPAVIEGRRYYRKTVALPGTCYRAGEKHRAEAIVVENISHYGMRIRTQWKALFKVGEFLHVSFILDDVQRTEIRKTVLVKNVRDRLIGVEFSEPDVPNATLGFYLMPE
jgi:hypothetical protein